MKEFTTRESHCFAQAKDDGSGALFTSQERQWLVLQVLQGLRAGPSDLEALQGKANVEEGQSIGKNRQFHCDLERYTKYHKHLYQLCH